MKRRLPIWLVPIALLLTGAGVWTAASYLRLPAHEETVTERPIEVRDEGYVSSRTCKACHPAQYDSWSASYHRTMTQVVTPATVVTELDGTKLQTDDTTYRIERRGDRYWVEQTDRSKSGAREQRPIVMSTGSHHMQLYWTASGEGRKVEMLPFHFLIDERMWIPRRAAFLIPPGKDRFGIQWNVNCIHCHSTRGRPRANEHKVDSHVAEFGIACEACHGPAAEHVRANRNPLHRYGLGRGEGDRGDIVNPSSLSQSRSSEVCGRCHAYGAPVRRDFRWNGFEYAAGEELAASRKVYRRTDFGEAGREVAERMFWEDGMARGAGREFGSMLVSPCYERGEMTCLSCHSMHRPEDDPRPLAEWADDQLKPGMDGDAACLQCHETYAENVTAHTHHTAGSSGSACYNCHMSHTTYGLLKAIRSHMVDSPTVAASLHTGRPNACNQCHLDKTLAWTAGYLEEWYETPVPELDEDERTVAASTLWLLRGDAAQRALMAWSMGWAPAREASGSQWMAPHLAQLLEDPYPAVRFIAQRSLRDLPGFEDFEYDFLASTPALREARLRAVAHWKRLGASGPPATLVDGAGRLRDDAWSRLLAQRNDRPVVVVE